MAYEVNEFGRDVACPGLIIPESRPMIASAVLADAKDSVGGFPVFAKVGEVDKVYPTKVSGAEFIGIVTRRSTNEEWAAKEMVNVLKKGSLWVKVKGEAQANQPAYINASLEFTATAEGGTAVGGKFLTNAIDGALAILEIL